MYDIINAPMPAPSPVGSIELEACQRIESPHESCENDELCPGGSIYAEEKCDQLIDSQGSASIQLVSSGDDSSDSEIDDAVSHIIKMDSSERPLGENIGVWAAQLGIARDNVTELLKILREKGVDVPADARTVLKTPRSVSDSEVSGGRYGYLGIKYGLIRLLGSKPWLFSNIETIELQCNIDGIPVFKSSSLSLWPILCKFSECPFLVAIWAGEKSPVDDAFLKLVFLMNWGI